MSTSSTLTQSRELLENFHPRKLLVHSSLYMISPTEAPAVSPAQENTSVNNSLEANVIVVLAVLVCSVISSLGLFCILNCARSCSSFVAAESAGANPSASAKLADAGVEKKVLKAFPTVKYTKELKLPRLDAACVICLSEFVAGERLRILPKCNHGFHTPCIDTWLTSHSSCPTCRNCLTETDQRAVNCRQGDSLEQANPAQEST